jgi:hypothetical protein
MDQNINTSQIFEFIKFIQTDILSKITSLSLLINDISKQLNMLVVLDSQPPSRLELLEKIKLNSSELESETLDILQTQFKKTNEKLIIYDGIIYNISEITLKITSISDQINLINTKINSNLDSYKFIFKVVVVVVSIVPIIWAIFTWFHSQGFIK